MTVSGQAFAGVEPLLLPKRSLFARDFRDLALRGRSRMSPRGYFNWFHTATHEQITLWVVAHLEDVFTNHAKPPFSIEGNGPQITLPHSEPNRRGAGRLGARKNMSHEPVSQSRAMM